SYEPGGDGHLPYPASRLPSCYWRVVVKRNVFLLKECWLQPPALAHVYQEDQPPVYDSLEVGCVEVSLEPQRLLEVEAERVNQTFPQPVSGLPSAHAERPTLGLCVNRLDPWRVIEAKPLHEEAAMTRHVDLLWNAAS